MEQAVQMSQAMQLAGQYNLDIVDKTLEGGCFWIVAGEEFSPMLEPLGFRFARNGGRATHKKPSWYLPTPEQPDRRHCHERVPRPIIYHGGRFEENRRRH